MLNRVGERTAPKNFYKIYFGIVSTMDNKKILNLKKTEKLSIQILI